jgi:hypothetical protein
VARTAGGTRTVPTYILDENIPQMTVELWAIKTTTLILVAGVPGLVVIISWGMCEIYDIGT